MLHRPPTKAIVLAAGFGTRMLPLSRDLPKPLMPLWGTPMIEHLLRLLWSWDVQDVLINLHHEPGQILEFLRSRKDWGLHIDLSFEPEILGTGGALRRAEWFLDGSPFWMVNADIAAALDPRPLLDAFHTQDALAALWMHPTRGPRTVEMKDGLVTNFRSARPGAENTFTFCGLHLLAPRVMAHIPANETISSVITAYEHAMAGGERIAGVCVPRAYWADVGTPEQYLRAHRETWPRRRGTGRGFFVAAAPNVTIGRGAHIHNSVLWDGARVAGGVRVDGAVIGRGAVVRRDTEYMAARADRVLDREELRAVTRLGWIPAKTTAYPMPPRGSARRFTRLATGSQSAILVRYSLERAENALYDDHAALLRRAGVRVPAVLLSDPANRLTVIEDLGDRNLADAVRDATPRATRQTYERVLEQVVLFHGAAFRAARRRRTRMMPPFGAALYRWERNYFAQQFLVEFARVDGKTVRLVKAELARAAAALGREPATLIHRDLQSSNVLLTGDGPALIDFQGMRFGPASYDLASLLCDPYVSLPEPIQMRLLDLYCERTGRDFVRDTFWVAAVERLAQALGAFARLSRLPGMDAFAAHIAPALRMLRRALDHVDGMQATKNLADDLIAIDTP